MSNKSFTKQNIRIAKSLVERQKIRSSEKYRMLNTHPNKILFKQFIAFRCFPLEANIRSDLSNLLFKNSISQSNSHRTKMGGWVGTVYFSIAL